MIIEPEPEHRCDLPTPDENVVPLGTLAACTGCGRWHVHRDTFTGDWSPLSGWVPVRWFNRRLRRRIRERVGTERRDPWVQAAAARGPLETLTHWHENRGHHAVDVYTSVGGQDVLVARACDCGVTLPPIVSRDPDGIARSEAWADLP